MNEMIYDGKSKAIFSGPDENSLIIRYKDDATAFNAQKKAVFSGKGRLNSAISNLLYEYLNKHGVETHLIRSLDETSDIVKKAEIIMVEVIVRNTAAGSFSQKYDVPEGTALNNTILEFSLKNDPLGDPMINESQITAIGIAVTEELEEMKHQALKINDLLTELFIKANIRLIDFKLEFGRVNGKIILCDEISPDSCRLWDVDTDKKLDKDRFRRDMGNVLESYRIVLERLENVVSK